MIFLLTFYENSLRLCEHKCKIFLSLSRHIKKQLGKRSKNFLFAHILKPNKPAKGRLFLSKKSTDECYLIAVKNKNSSFVPEQRKKRLNNFLEICIHLNNSSVEITNGLVSKKRICGVTSSTNFKLLLVYRLVVLVLFLSSFVSVLLS